MYGVREWRPELGGEEAASQDMRPAAGVDSDRDRSGWGSRPGSQSNRRSDGGRRDNLEAEVRSKEAASWWDAASPGHNSRAEAADGAGVHC